MRDLLLAESASVSNGEQAARVAERRERLGLSKAKLSALAGVDRETLTKVETGQEVTPAKLGQILAALDGREFEHGLDPQAQEETEPQTFSFVVEGDFGVKVTAKGPITDHDLLREDVIKIIRSINRSEPEV